MDNHDILQAIQETTGALGGLEQMSGRMAMLLEKRLLRLRNAMDKTLDPVLTQKYVVGTTAVMGVLEKEMGLLQKRLGGLKTAIMGAMAPVGAVVVPALSNAVSAATRFAEKTGLVLRGLLYGEEAGDAMSKGLQKTATGAKKAASAGAKAAKSLAGFDEITRLNRGSGSGSSQTGVEEPAVTLPKTVQDTISPQLQAVVAKIQAILEPLRNIDFTFLLQQLTGLGVAFVGFGNVVLQALEGLWYSVLTPFVTWLAEQFAPAFSQTVTAAIQTATAVLSPLGTGVLQLLQCMQPVFSFVGQTAVAILGTLKGAFENLTQVFTERGPKITEIFQGIGTVIATMFDVISPILSGLQILWTAVFEGLGTSAAGCLGGVIDGLHGVTQFLQNVFSGAWSDAWAGVKECLKGIVNGVLGFLNRMLSGVAGAVNRIVGVVNKLSFQVPDWVPGLGGKSFGFRLPTVSVPQIPYLAKGAVLPANKPFMAVVGDQRHGTNIEAPLATIQEAVALVMQDQTSAIVAGFDASVGVQREILEAVLGIHIGDDVIANATNRYQSRLATMRGGTL